MTADEREQLYNEVWLAPLIEVARRYNVSDTTIRNRCKKLSIPLPTAGYWVKVKNGQSPVRIPLPVVTGELKKHIRNYIIRYKTKIEELTDEELKLVNDLELLTESTQQHIMHVCENIKLSSQLRNPHKLILSHKEEISQRKKKEKEPVKQHTYNQYKLIENVTGNIRVLPIKVSETLLNIVYRIFNKLFEIIEDLEGFIQVTTNGDKDKASIVIMHTSFDFMLNEVTKKNVEANKLIFSMTPNSRFSDCTEPKLEYNENTLALEYQLGQIILDMFKVANRLMAKDELKQRDEKRRLDEFEKKRSLEKMRAGELEEIKIIDQAAKDWEKAERIRTFINAFEVKVKDTDNPDEKTKLAQWIKWAQDKADWIDPLVDKDDEVLGYSNSIINKLLNK